MVVKTSGAVVFSNRIDWLFPFFNLRIDWKIFVEHGFSINAFSDRTYISDTQRIHSLINIAIPQKNNELMFFFV